MPWEPEDAAADAAETDSPPALPSIAALTRGMEQLTINPTPSPLDPSGIPHIWDRVIFHADNTTRRALRQTSHYLVKPTEQFLFAHVAVHISQRGAMRRFVIGPSASSGPIPRLDWNGDAVARARCRRFLAHVTTLDIVLHCPVPINGDMDDEFRHLESLLANVTIVRCHDDLRSVFNLPRLKKAYGFFTMPRHRPNPAFGNQIAHDLLPHALGATVTDLTITVTYDGDSLVAHRRLFMGTIRECKGLKKITVTLRHNMIPTQVQAPINPTIMLPLHHLLEDVEPMLREGLHLDIQGLERFPAEWLVPVPVLRQDPRPSLDVIRYCIFSSLYRFRNGGDQFLAALIGLHGAPKEHRQHLVWSTFVQPFVSSLSLTTLPPNEVDMGLALRMYLVPTSGLTIPL
ncbi:uncharacterized protein LOC62_07G008920 [Vanrija pseudolonga]|uniref:Uncharacterized protein n=1 Tax=Vanrija pseudolonga TaxID=143232 RepID=A0AAF1BL45_9TREE|nr:hypothetical protein LOC62_07G008920 [Vanrija pseudolonga]